MWRKTLQINGYEVSDVSYPLVDSDTRQEYDEERNKAFDRVFKKIDEFQKGEDKAVPIEQAAKLLQFKNSKPLYNLVRRGIAPVFRDSTQLKIPINWIKKAGEGLNLDDFRLVTQLKESWNFDITSWPGDSYELADGVWLISVLPSGS